MMLSLHIHTMLDKPNKSVPDCANSKCRSLLSKRDVVIGYVESHVHRVP
jgi:hypothetical protein